MLIDTHAHLDDKQFQDDINETVNRATDSGISKIITVSSTPGSIQRTLEITDNFPNIYGAAGLHPHDAKYFDKKIEKDILDAITKEKIVAIGEIGLDFHYNHSPREDQLRALKKQIEIATECSLPIIVHDRGASSELIKIFEDFRGKIRGVIHCFTGDSEVAKKYLDLGFYISFSGIVTFPKAENIRNAAKIIPPEKILIETDSPYLAPVPMRGKRNEPGFVRFVCEALSKLLNMDFDELSDITTKNAKNLFILK